ncbi:MAG TPA: PQQ-dependent sugar dehydrogenase [Actinomycetota bacterium]|nr:PQQ-dependent sugar dehydrogenase [Actinomycetota bacterium]
MRLPAGVPHRARTASLIVVLALVAVVLPTATGSAGTADPAHLGIHLAGVASGLDQPVAIAQPNDGSGRLFVVEQPGRIRVWTPGGGLLSTPYLDIHTKVLSGGERGLLGLAFHPNFSTNGLFYVYYTNTSGNLQISRFHATPSSNTADGSSEYGIMNIAHPTYANHNGGQLQFWNGYLYIGTGDGGGAGDPSGNAQNLKSFLGKILRIDINHTCGTLHYCNPSSNPYYGKSYARYEIWLFGLRNPWRFSFQRGNGSMWIGDVGQDTREEIDLLSPGVSGKNMGWDCYEGTLNTINTYGGSYCNGKTFTPPIYNYSHVSGRCAIIGGYKYTGSGQSTLMGGLYFFADYCTGEIWALNHVGSHWPSTLVGKDGNSITSFGESVNGELFLTDTGGNLYHLKAYHR